jgi:hypothetical protein
LFQTNPKTFDIDGHFATNPVETRWTVRQHRKEIALGDRVFIWRAIGSGDAADSGIIAEATVISTVAPRPELPVEIPFWTNPADANQIEPRVDLRLERIAAKRGVIQREWIREDPILRELRILTMANATNFSLTPSETERIAALWERTGRDWTRAESIAGLFAYQETYGSAVSRGPGSPVSNIAVLIGRAVAGVYNKVMNFRHLDPRDSREGLSGASARSQTVLPRSRQRVSCGASC